MYKYRLFLWVIAMVLGCSVGIAQLWEPIPFQLSYPPHVVWADTTEDVLYVGGDFRYVDSIRVDKLLRFDGATWDTFPKRVPLLQVFCFQRYQGKLYVGGNGGFAIWDGHDWELIHSEEGFVSQMEPRKGKLIVAGSFLEIGGDSINSVAVWDGHSISDPFKLGNFLAPMDIAIISSIAIYKSELYIGGNFNGIGIAADILRWTGTNWTTVGGGIHAGSMDFVNDLEIYRDELYVTGNFKESSGSPGNNIAKWNGQHWSRVGDGVGQGEGDVLRVFEDKLILGGAFYNMGNVLAPFLASWDGENWCHFGGYLDNAVLNLTEFRGELIAAGGLRVMGGDSVRFIGTWKGGQDVDTCLSYPVAIANPESTEAMLVSTYPNPTSSYITFTLPPHITAQVNVRDPQGRTLIFTHNYTPSEQVDVSNLPSGLYLVEVSWKDHREVLKLIKQ